MRDVAESQDLTGKKKDEKGKEAEKVDPRPTAECVVIGYVLADDGESLGGLVVATLREDKLTYAGVVERGLTPETGKELLARLKKLHREEPLIRNLNLKAIWVKPSVFCEVHQSGMDEQGRLRDPKFKAILE